MNTLYGKQKQVADEVANALQIDNPLLNHVAYISGEMGVGKTYMAADIIRQLQDSELLTLVISPKEVTHKWQSVLNGFGVTDVTIFDRKKQIPHTGVLIIVDKDLTPAKNELLQRNINLIVYDEIHKLKPDSKVFENLKAIRKRIAKINENPQNNFQLKNMMLGLTGTIFGQNIDKLLSILKYTHPNLSFAIHNTFFQLPMFMANWTKIAWIISLSDVESHFKSDATDDLEQTIAPIKLIDPTPEQKLVYEVARNQLAGAQFPKYNEEAILLLDYPRLNQFKSRNLKISKEHGPLPHAKKKYSLTFSLQDIDFKHTPKYQQLLSILDDPQKTLIFANDESLIEKLDSVLTEDGYKTKTLPKSLKSHEYSNYINEALSSDFDIFILNPMKISVGVDINTASRIIWYQLLSDLGSTIQAQRRVYRLSSTKSSIIHYLAYDKTYQADLINEISESSKRNAAAYGTNDTSNLAKLSGVLFNTQL